VNPAASKPERSWLVSRYIDVIRFVKKKYNMPVILTGGPGEYDKALGEAISAQVSVINLIGQTKPKQLLAVMQHACLALCPDTGPSHMAGAVGTPVIALHAVTHVDVSGPYLFRQHAVNRYPEAVSHVLKKTLETCPWGTHVHGDEAMQLISVDDVILKIQSVMSSLYARVSYPHEHIVGSSI
jgi:heptosyltransferase I